jgi:hypothetical protein
MHIDARAEMGTVYEAREDLECAGKMYREDHAGYGEIPGLDEELARADMATKLSNLHRRHNKLEEAEKKPLTPMR